MVLLLWNSLMLRNIACEAKNDELPL